MVQCARTPEYEYGIRDIGVTGVQTCALPIFEKLGTASEVTAYLQHLLDLFRGEIAGSVEDPFAAGMIDLRERAVALAPSNHVTRVADRIGELRSEERSRGKDGTMCAHT